MNNSNRLPLAVVSAIAVVWGCAIWLLQDPRQKDAISTVSALSATADVVIAIGTQTAMVQRWSLLGGDKCELVVRSIGETAGSRGLSVECDASADQQLVLNIDAKIQSGRWTLRVDDGEQAPNYLLLTNYPACRVTGGKHYRFLIYTDDTGSAISVKDITIRPATGADDELPLVWPTSGPILEQYLKRQGWSEGWADFLRLSDAGGTADRARVITNFVYQRSHITGSDGPTFVRFGGAYEWERVPTRTVDGLCGTFASATLDLYAKLGITGRRVSLATRGFAEGRASGDTHELVEAFDPVSGRWVLFDPSFGLMFQDPDGNLLGLKELMKAAAEGEEWRVVPIGTLRAGRRIDEYYLSYSDLLWMGDAPAVPSLGDKGAAYRSRAQTVGEIYRAMYPSPSTP